jgi:sarcosine oxidase subunit alpha
MPRDNSTSIQRGEPINLVVDHQEVSAYAGETLATVLLAQGITAFNRTAKGQPRGPYCNMGSCFECQVQMADGNSNMFRWVRACMVDAEPGMQIITGATLITPPGEPVIPVNDPSTAGGRP